MYPKIPLLVGVVSSCSQRADRSSQRKWGKQTYHMMKRKNYERLERKTIVRRVVEWEECLSNMHGERVEGMRRVKERSVVVIFVSELAKLAPNPLSPYLSPASHHLCKPLA